MALFAKKSTIFLNFFKRDCSEGACGVKKILFKDVDINYCTIFPFLELCDILGSKLLFKKVVCLKYGVGSTGSHALWAFLNIKGAKKYRLFSALLDS